MRTDGRTAGGGKGGSRPPELSASLLVLLCFTRFWSDISNTRRMRVVGKASRHVQEQLLRGGVLEYPRKLARDTVLVACHVDR